MKLIFFDIDGTLVPDDHSLIIPESAKAAIRKARENGHICMINTGRTKCMVRSELTDQVEFDGILYGCGTMADYQGKELFHRKLPVELAKRMIAALRKYKIDAVIEGRDSDFREYPEDMHTELFRNFMKYGRKYPYEHYDDAPGKCDKMYAYVDKAEKLEGFYQEFCEELDFIDRERGFYEIVPKGYSKGSGILHMAELLGIPVEDTVAIGDSNNDLPMLECAGISIGMGDSTQNVKDIADYVTARVEDDGIEKALAWLGVI